MKKIVLKVVKQCAATEGVTLQYIKQDILPDFFKVFWVRRMALDCRDYKKMAETTVELAQKAGASEITGCVVNGLKDEAEPYRKMATVWRLSRKFYRPSAHLTLMRSSKSNSSTVSFTLSNSKRPRTTSC